MCSSIEDDTPIREGIAEVLEMEGYSVSQAGDGREGLREASEHHPNLILLDLMMPNMNGWQFRDAQKEDVALAEVPVIVISAVATEPWSRLEGVAALFRKPFDTAGLLAAVARHATGEGVAARVTRRASGRGAQLVQRREQFVDLEGLVQLPVRRRPDPAQCARTGASRAYAWVIRIAVASTFSVRAGRSCPDSARGAQSLDDARDGRWLFPACLVHRSGPPAGSCTVKVAMAGMRRGPGPVLRGTRKPLVLGKPGKGPIMSRQAIQVRNSLSAPTPGKRHSTFVQPTTQRLQDGGIAVHVEEALAVRMRHGQDDDAPTHRKLARGGSPPRGASSAA
jgi:CheY-like chemotaxis protein